LNEGGDAMRGGTPFWTDGVATSKFWVRRTNL